MTPSWKARAKQRASLLATRGRTTSHDGRTSIEEAACNSPQPPDPRGDGGTEAGGDNAFDRAIAIYTAQQAAGIGQYQAYRNSLIAFQHNTSAVYHPASNYLAQAQMAQMSQSQLAAMAQAQNHNFYSAGLLASSGSGVLGGLFSVPPGGLVTIPAGYALSHFMPMPSAPEPPLPVEVKAGEIVAWRCWRCEGAGFRSMANETEWNEGAVLEAPKFDLDTGVGIHAWKTRAQAETYAASYSHCTVSIGTIELWGVVIEHEEGYRAQFGQIKDIVETRAAIPAPSPAAYLVQAMPPLVPYDPFPWRPDWFWVSVGVAASIAVIGGLAWLPGAVAAFALINLVVKVLRG